MAEVAGYEPSVEAFWAGKVEGFAVALEARVREEQAAGDARPDMDPAMASRVVAGPWSGTSPATWRSTTAGATTPSPRRSHA